MSKSIVITGCSSGFGRLTGLYLARQGWHVFATVRKEADRESLQAEAAEAGCAEHLQPVICDITDAGQVAALSQKVAEVTAQLDALVNNAGTAFPAPLELLGLDELRSQLEINLIGHLAVTQALLPSLKAAGGMIINVSSVGGRIAMPILGAYNISKFALEALSDVLRVELAPFGVRVVVIEPGSSDTAIWNTSRRRASGRLQAVAGQSPYLLLINAIEKFSRKSAANGFPPQLFADTVLKILNNPHPRARYAIPGDVARSILLRKLLPDAIWDRILRRSLKW